MALSQNDIVLLEGAMKQNGGKAARAAADLGLNYDDVLEYVGSPAPKFNNNRPELKKYIIASKKVDSAWPSSTAIEIAQREYDLGKIELCQYREGNTIHLLSIKRKVVARRPVYFQRVPTEYQSGRKANVQAPV